MDHQQKYLETLTRENKNKIQEFRSIHFKEGEKSYFTTLDQVSAKPMVKPTTIRQIVLRIRTNEIS